MKKSFLTAYLTQTATMLRGAVAVYVLCGASLLPTHAQAPGDLRVALVIGNAAYAGAAALANPTNDAKAMSETLRSLGFSVIEVRDGSKVQMLEAIGKVKDALQGKQAVGMLYYAGHGLQVDWRNYMVPIDAKMSKASEVSEQTVDLSQVIDAFKAAGNRMNIVVLDACRDNPFAGSSTGKGLAQLDAPTGTFLAYATAPGNVAEDGDSNSSNGLYTQFLLQELKKPAAKIEDVFKRVRLNVRQQSQGRQIPWESTSLEDDFFFNAGLKPAQILDYSEKEKAFAEEKSQWEKIKDSKNVGDFYAFLQKHPTSFISENAYLRIDQLQNSKLTMVPDQNGILPVSVSARTFRLGDQRVLHVTNMLTQQSSRRSQTVTRINDGLVEFNDGAEIWDQTGSIVKNSLGVYSPGILQEPLDLSIGKKWRTAYESTRFDGIVHTSFRDYHVTGYETITVPEGTFKAFLLVGTGYAKNSMGATAIEHKTWVDVKSRNRVRSEIVFKFNTKITQWTVTESVSHTQSL
jgi:Caspase domain